MLSRSSKNRENWFSASFQWCGDVVRVARFGVDLLADREVENLQRGLL